MSGEETFSEAQALQDMQDAQIGRSRAIQTRAGLAALNEPFCTIPDHTAIQVALQATDGTLAELTRRLEAAEAENAALRAAGQAMHDWIDDHNPDGTEVVCNVCLAEGYDGNGLRHEDDCPLHRWRALTNPNATEGTTGEGNG